jgi:plasmid maintenance system antidote protein VapI
MPMKNPPHPGDFIRTEIIEAAGLTVTLHKRESARNKSVCRAFPC